MNTLLGNLHAYKAKPNATVDQTAVEIKKMAIVIGKIKATERPSDLILALTLIKVIDRNQYALAKWQLKETEDLTFMFALEKLKAVELDNRDRDATTPVIEIANKATGNGAGKRKKFSGECFYCSKKGHRKNECRQWLGTDEGKKWAKEQSAKTDRGKSAGGNAARTADTTQDDDSGAESA